MLAHQRASNYSFIRLYFLIKIQPPPYIALPVYRITASHTEHNFVVFTSLADRLLLFLMVKLSIALKSRTQP